MRRYALKNRRLVVPTLEVGGGLHAIVDSLNIIRYIANELASAKGALTGAAGCEAAEIDRLVALQDGLPVRAITYISLVDRARGVASLERKLATLAQLGQDCAAAGDPDGLQAVFADKCAATATPTLHLGQVSHLFRSFTARAVGVSWSRADAHCARLADRCA